MLLDAGADVNQVTRYGWSPLLAATQNRNYQLGKFLIERGADVNLANKGGWTPLYLATDNRNLEGGDYPTRTPDMDDLEFIKLLLDAGADANAQLIESTETRTVFTNQWLDEEGATAFLRASQSGDVELMRLLLERGADPKIYTKLGVTPLAAAAGIGWVEGVTSERSPEQTVEAVKMLLELGVDPDFQADTGRTALHGAAHKGATEVVKVLVAAGARMDIRDFGNTDNRGSAELAAHTWLAIDYADGLVRVGVQSAIAHPETAKVLRELMLAAGVEAPPEGRTLESICIVDVCSPDYDPDRLQLVAALRRAAQLRRVPRRCCASRTSPHEPADIQRNATFLSRAFERRGFDVRLVTNPASRPAVFAELAAAARDADAALLYALRRPAGHSRGLVAARSVRARRQAPRCAGQVARRERGRACRRGRSIPSCACSRAPRPTTKRRS